MLATDWVVPLLFLALGALGAPMLVWIFHSARQPNPRRGAAFRSSQRQLDISANSLEFEVDDRKPLAAIDHGQLNWDMLTARQHEVALRAARGKTSLAIAQELVLSPRTIDNHLAQVYKKLHVQSRAELKHKLQDMGVLASPPQDRAE